MRVISPSFLVSLIKILLLEALHSYSYYVSPDQALNDSSLVLFYMYGALYIVNKKFYYPTLEDLMAHLDVTLSI